MSRIQNQMDEQLSCRCAVVHHIYTFLFRPLPHLQEELISARGRARVQTTLQDRGANRFRGIHAHWGSREMEEEGLSDMLDPFLALQCPCLEFSEAPVDVQLKLVPEGTKDSCSREAVLEETLTLFPSGHGFVDIRIVVPPSRNAGGLGKKAIVDLSTMGLRRTNGLGSDGGYHACGAILKLPRKRRETLIFDLFQSTVTKVYDVLSESRIEGGHLKWIDVEEGLVGESAWSLSRGKRRPGNAFALPYPVFIGEMSPRTYATLFESDLDATRSSVPKFDPKVEDRQRHDGLRQHLLRDLLTVIYRSREWECPDETFAADQLGLVAGRLPNMCSISRWFTYLYCRICVALSPMLSLRRGKITERPGSYMEQALIETVSFLRMQWHCHAVNNLRLDRVLSRAYGEFREIVRSFDTGGGDRGWKRRQELVACLAARQAELIESQSAVIHALQDPITARLGSQSMSTLYEKGLRAFRVRRMRDALVEKLHALNSFYEEIASYRRRSEATVLQELYERTHPRFTGQNPGSGGT